MRREKKYKQTDKSEAHKKKIVASSKPIHQHAILYSSSSFHFSFILSFFFLFPFALPSNINGIFIGINLTIDTQPHTHTTKLSQLGLCYNDPNAHPFITDYEKAYLLDELGQQQQQQTQAKKMVSNETNKQQTSAKRSTPWRQILTNAPFIALILCQVSYTGQNESVSLIPLYLYLYLFLCVDHLLYACLYGAEKKG